MSTGWSATRPSERSSPRDQARAYYYKRYFDIDDPDDPKLYHFVLNTSELGIEYATSIVIEAAQALGAGHMRQTNRSAS